MHLTQEQLDEVTEMAKLFYPASDIAINIEVDTEEFVLAIKAQDNDIYKAYRKGWLISDIKLRKSILTSAENGSNPAQQMLRQIQQETTARESYE
jgi:hypothetical protein